MSKKRAAAVAESSHNERTSEDSEPAAAAAAALQSDGNVKRSKLASTSGTTLQDLATELLEPILVKAVVQEVRGMKLAKYVWKEKADLVMSRLGTVCSQWNSILATDFCRNKVHQILDDTAEETISLEIVHRSWFRTAGVMATMKDEIYVLHRPYGQVDHVVDVYDRNDLADPKAVIPIAGKRPECMAACGLSDCLYITNRECKCYSVLRITKDEEHKYVITAPWIKDLKLPAPPAISVSRTGSLICFADQQRREPTIVNIYDTNGALLQRITLAQNIYRFKSVRDVIQKSNGNLVLVLIDDRSRTRLTEIDLSGNVVLEYEPSFQSHSGFSIADTYGRILITGFDSDFELLDSEFNLLDFDASSPLVEDCADDLVRPYGMHFNNERNEIVRLYEIVNAHTYLQLVIFRFTEG